MSNPSLAEYKVRFKARIHERLDDPAWRESDIDAIAEAEFDGFYDTSDPESFDTSHPEDDADECLSYWDADGEE